MKFLRLIQSNWRLLLSALVAGAVVHIWTTLANVHTGEAAGYQRLVANLPLNQISYLPPITPRNHRLPFLMPDNRYAICHFDARTNPIRIRAEIPAPGWSLSMHAPNGDNFLFVAGLEDRVTRLNIAVRPAGQIFRAKTITGLAPAKKAPEITIQRERGVAIFKAPVTSLALRRQIDEQMSSFECYTEARSR